MMFDNFFSVSLNFKRGLFSKQNHKTFSVSFNQM